MYLNVEQIMSDIREDLHLQETWEDLPDFESVPFPSGAPGRAMSEGAGYDMAEFPAEVEELNHAWNITYYWPLSFKPYRRFIQKVIRRILKFLFVILIHQQNEVNMRVVRAFNGTKAYIDYFGQQNASLNRQTAALKHQVWDMQNQINALKRQNEDLSDNLARAIEELHASNSSKNRCLDVPDDKNST